MKILEKRLDSLFSTRMEDKHIPGAAFIIVKDGKTILKKGYGFSRLGSQIQYVNPDSAQSLDDISRQNRDRHTAH